jgi:hypothetical protein
MSREAFEAWIKRDSTLSVERDGEGYRDMDVYIQWRAWQAAQADAFERAEDADVLTDDMLRYAMAALGTNSPADADLYRAFWLHAITARKSNTALAKEAT